MLIVKAFSFLHVNVVHITALVHHHLLSSYAHDWLFVLSSIEYRSLHLGHFNVLMSLTCSPSIHSCGHIHLEFQLLSINCSINWLLILIVTFTWFRVFWNPKHFLTSLLREKFVLVLLLQCVMFVVIIRTGALTWSCPSR